MCMKPNFLNTIVKEPDGFSKYVNLLINYRDQKLENCENIVTTIFFEQSIKEKRNT